MDLIRVWKEMDIDEIEKHIVVVDDIQGHCPQCKKTGIKYEDFKKCPSCGADFLFATVRDSGAISQIMHKLQNKAPHLTVIDNSDYNQILAKKKTKGLFKDI